MERNFIKLFNHAYAIIAHCLIESHVYMCDCRYLVRDSVTQLEEVLQDMQELPDINYSTRNCWTTVVNQARSKLADYCDESRNILLRCRNIDYLSSSQTLELHLLAHISTTVALQVIWKDLVIDCVNVHPTKSNLEILEFTKESFLLFGSIHPDITEMIKVYPQHYLTLILTSYDKPDSLDKMCSKALKFLHKSKGDALVASDRENIGNIIKSQITKLGFTEGGPSGALDNCMDIDSEQSWSDQFTTESSEDSDCNPFDDDRSNHEMFY